MDQMNDRLERLLDDSMSLEERRDSWMAGSRSRMLVEMMKSAYMGGNFGVAEKILRALERVFLAFLPKETCILCFFFNYFF